MPGLPILAARRRPAAPYAVLIAVLFIALLSPIGCSYPISRSLRSQADSSVSFAELRANPTMYLGRVVILGGVIGRCEEHRGGLLIEIDHKPLDYWGRPIRTSVMDGRFFAFASGRQAGLSCASRRAITVAGAVERFSTISGNDSVPDEPTVQAVEITFWPPDTAPRTDPAWIDPLYDPSISPRAR